MDFKKYKDRLVQYANSNGITVTSGQNIGCFLPEHGSSDSNQSMNFKDDTWKCFKCDSGGDIYDLAGFFNSTSNKVEQFNIISKFFDGVSYEPNQKKEKQPFDFTASEIVTGFMRENAIDNKTKMLSFAKFRGYGESFSNQFGYWPGLDKAISVLGEDVLKLAKIPMPYGDSKKGTSWKPSGIVAKYKHGWKLMYRRGDKTIKRASWDADVFPFPLLLEALDIILVEAEISAIAGLINNFNMMSTGGTNGLNKSNYQLLHKYESVTFLFDADNAGESAYKKATELIKSGFNGIVKVAKLIATDYGKDPDDYIKSGHIKELTEIIENAPFYHIKPEETEIEDFEETTDFPFKFLGFSEHHHYFFDRRDTIIKTPVGKMTSGQLLEIASLEFWQSIKIGKQGQPDWPFIIDKMIMISSLKGPYKKSSIRGTGIWEDNGEIIASDGEKIICKSGRIAVRDYKSKLTYIRRPETGIDSVINEKYKSDFKFLKWTSEELSFATKQDGKLLYGWAISSLFLSTIRWRPIIYMKGPSSVGKSWVMNNILREILGDIAICPKKNSTVIGVMQAPGYDSRMTTVDELENGHDMKTKDLVRGLMTLARDTTTKSKESRFVGTADQEGLSNDFTSMFLFASIVESSEEDQDINRITAVNFFPKKQKNWDEIQSKILYEVKNGLGDRLRHNAIFYRESVVKNIYLFQKIAGAMATAQRNGDQLGTLIAGWYHLEFPGKIANESEAAEYINGFDFTEQEERSKGEMMKNILSSVLSFKIRYEEETIVSTYDGIEDRIKNRERPVYEILRELKLKKETGEDIIRHDLNKALMAYGLRYGTKKNPEYLAIAQGHEKIRNMLPHDFSYRSNYHGYLIHHESFIEKERVVKFLGTNHQALLFNIDLDEEEYLDEVPF